MQMKWLTETFNKEVLTIEEMTPYVRLFLNNRSGEEKEEIAEMFGELDDDMQCRFLEAADIYDVPELFRLCPRPTMRHAEILLRKEPPPYEKKTQLILDKVFYAINDYSKKLLEETAEKLEKEGKAPAHFEENYGRFQEILEDEELLLSLYPKARG